GRLRGPRRARPALPRAGPEALSRRAAALAAALALVVLARAAVRSHTRRDSLSADEPIHILAGYLEVFGRTAIVNIEHPPLMKALAGLGLATLPLPPAAPH